MPCSDYGIEEYYSALPARVHELTRLLCEACKLLDKAKVTNDKRSVGLAVWWTKHQRDDWANRKR